MVKQYNITLVGDGAVGKTCLLFRYKDGVGPDENNYVATIFKEYVKDINRNDKYIQIKLTDNAGQEEFDILRCYSYPTTDMFLVCFDVNKRESLENVIHVWNPEIRKHNKKAPILLVGTKNDSRDMINEDDIKTIGMSINASGIFTCSAKTGNNVNKIFDVAIDLLILNNSKKCKIL